jgi:nucleoid-associated protein Lsr2
VGTITIKTDDITGENIPGNVVVKLAVEGKEIEVSEATASALRAMFDGDLAVFTEYAKTYVKKTHKATATAGGKLDMAEVRTWAKANGLDVKDRGAVPAEVIEKYRLSLAS